MPNTDHRREKPRCVAIVLCDDVMKDHFSGKTAAWGLFNAVVAARVPSAIRLCVLATFGEGRGVWQVTLRVRDSQRQVVFQTVLPMNFTDPLAAYDLTFRVGNLPLTSPGVYDVDLLVDSEPVGHREFRVTCEEGGA